LLARGEPPYDGDRLTLRDGGGDPAEWRYVYDDLRFVTLKDEVVLVHGDDDSFDPLAVIRRRAASGEDEHERDDDSAQDHAGSRSMRHAIGHAVLRVCIHDVPTPTMTRRGTSFADAISMIRSRDPTAATY
jgi:hypothetical protein